MFAKLEHLQSGPLQKKIADCPRLYRGHIGCIEVKQNSA